MTGDQGDNYEVLAVKLVGPVPEPKRPRYRTVYTTHVFTAAKESRQLFSVSDQRVSAMIQPLDDDLTINGKSSDAKAGNGAIIPKANNEPWPIMESGDLHGSIQVMAGATSRVTVTAVYITNE